MYLNSICQQMDHHLKIFKRVWSNLAYMKVFLLGVMLNMLFVVIFILKSSREGIVSKFNFTTNGPSLENFQTSLVKLCLHVGLLTRCYAQHALGRYTHSEIKDRRHCIKIPFVNKGVQFINLPRIFKVKALSLPLLLILKIRKHLALIFVFISTINLLVVFNLL